MIRYIHGSEDSLDTDVFYVMDKLPSTQYCNEFCTADPLENRNIIVVKDGIVTDCFIGTVDEVNNSLIDTYNLHEQEYPLIVTKRIPRNVILKQIRIVRGILSLLSHTQYRSEIKQALKGNWSDRLKCLSQVDITAIDFESLNKQMSGKDALKIIAFQIGQGLGLLDGKEFYTKKSVSTKYPALNPFLYRQDSPNLYVLHFFLRLYLVEIGKIKYEEINKNTVFFPDYKKTYELRHETEI